MQWLLSDQEICDTGEYVSLPNLPFPIEDVPAQAQAPALPPRYYGIAELHAGASIPLGDSTWQASVGPSPTVGGVVGGAWQGIAVALAVDFSPLDVHQGNALFPERATVESLNRLRVLAMVGYERAFGHVLVTARGGIGVDYLDARYQDLAQGTTTNESDSTVDLAVELGIAAWLRVGDDISVGGGLSLPIALRDQALQPATVLPLGGGSTDLAIVIGLRFESEHR